MKWKNTVYDYFEVNMEGSTVEIKSWIIRHCTSGIDPIAIQRIQRTDTISEILCKLFKEGHLDRKKNNLSQYVYILKTPPLADCISYEEHQELRKALLEIKGKLISKLSRYKAIKDYELSLDKKALCVIEYLSVKFESLLIKSNPPQGINGVYYNHFDSYESTFSLSDHIRFAKILKKTYFKMLSPFYSRSMKYKYFDKLMTLLDSILKRDYPLDYSHDIYF